MLQETDEHDGVMMDSTALPLDEHAVLPQQDSYSHDTLDNPAIFVSALPDTTSRGCCRTSRCCWCCSCCTGPRFRNFLHFVNTFAVAILAGVTTFLFLQVQYLHYTLNQEQQAIDNLQLALQNQTQGQIQELTNKVEEEHSLTMYQMAGTFALLACLLTMFHMSTHLRNYHQPLVQRKIVTILWMSPIYAVTSFFSLVFPSADGYLAVIKDFYEAYAIFTFLSFLIAVLGRGDRQEAIQVLSRHADHLKRPTKCLNGCYHPPPDTSDVAKAGAVVTECQILCMQFVFVRPLTSIGNFISTLIMDQQDYQPDFENDKYAYFKTPSFYLAMVTNVSVFLAFTGLLKFYHAVSEDLAWCQPFSKFLTIKGIVFLTFWQGLLISIIVSLTDTTDGDDDDNPQEYAAQIQNFLICLEMLFFSIAHWCVFPAEEWEPNYRPKEYAKPGIGLKDFVNDMSYIISSRSEARAHRRRVNSSFESVESHDEDEDERENGDAFGGDTEMTLDHRSDGPVVYHDGDDDVLDMHDPALNGSHLQSPSTDEDDVLKTDVNNAEDRDDGML